MIYLDEDLPNHPKLFRAGAAFGPTGPALVLALHVACIAHARKFLTDGFVPLEFFMQNSLIPPAADLAKVMASRRVKLLIRCRGGYRVNDFHDFNRKASDIKELREKARAKKRRQREAQTGRPRQRVPGPVPSLSLGDKKAVPSGQCRDPDQYHVRTYDPVLRSHDDHLSTGRTVPGSAVDDSPPVENLLKSDEKLRMAKVPADDGNYRVIARIARDVLQRLGVLEEGDLVEAVKTACAQAHIAYGPPLAEHDVVHRACTSELFKFRRPDIAGAAT